MAMRRGGRGGPGGGGPRRARKLQLGVKDVSELDYKNLELLQKCIGPQGQILSRRRTNLTAQQQRALKRAIKRARHLALLPFVG